MPVLFPSITDSKEFFLLFLCPSSPYLSGKFLLIVETLLKIGPHKKLLCLYS